MEQLWAPWRLAYLSGAERPEGCFFCDLGPPRADGSDALVVWRGPTTFALLNAYPYANGHVMVAPYAHEGDLDRLDRRTADELMAGVQRMVRTLRRLYGPEGFNVGANLGAAAGAGFGDHLHLHVVPRWAGDTNFMTTTAGVRVIPEALADTARRLREALARDADEGDEAR